MSRVGILCLAGIGHLNPSAALGRALQARGHLVTMIQAPISRARVRSAGLRFKALEPGVSVPINPDVSSGPRALTSTLDDLKGQALRVLTGAPRALQEEGIDIVVGDQADLAASTVAEHLGLPFVAISLFPPLHLDASVPPSIFGWRHSGSLLARCRNRIGNTILSALLAPIIGLVNQQRQQWKLRPFRGVNDVFAGAPIVAQLPKALEFPERRVPSNLVYTGPFFDGRGEYPLEFPWERLTGRPLVYASLGTVRNGHVGVFRSIARACADGDVELVVSLGGGRLLPEDVNPLPGNPIVVHYAPQLPLLKRADCVITHGGLNTTLEALACGVPLLAIPISDDQPGVAARIHRAGAGEVVPFKRASAERIRRSLQRVRDDRGYRGAAARLQHEIGRANGLELAADVIEAAASRVPELRAR